MKIIVIILLSLLAVIISCKQRQKHEDIFRDVPITYTKKFIDSIAHKIQSDAGDNFTACPILQKNQYYYDERNFRDSSGNLKEYSIIERWDTGDVFTNYFYHKNELIGVEKIVFTAHIHEMSNYYFRNDSLFHRHAEGRLTRMRVDTLLRNSFHYLSIKKDMGDTSYRKFFGKNSHPPNSIILHFQ